MHFCLLPFFIYVTIEKSPDKKGAIFFWRALEKNKMNASSAESLVWLLGREINLRITFQGECGVW